MYMQSCVYLYKQYRYILMLYKLFFYDVNDKNRFYVDKYLRKGCLDYLNIFRIQYCYVKVLSVNYRQSFSLVLI